MFRDTMKTRVILDLDSEDDTRLRMLAETRGQETARVVSDALALLDSMDGESPDIEEDLRRLETFKQTGMGVSLDDVKAWVRSWGTADELPPPTPRKIG
jgi:predicted transcriptional regulator